MTKENDISLGTNVLLVCSKCMCSSFSVIMTGNFLYLKCNDCEEVFNLSYDSLNQDPLTEADNSGLLIAANFVL